MCSGISQEYNLEYGGTFIAEGRSGAVFQSSEEHVAKYFLDHPYHDPVLRAAREAHYLQKLQGADFQVPDFVSSTIRDGYVSVNDEVSKKFKAVIVSGFIKPENLLTIWDAGSWSPQEQQDAYKSVAKLIAKIHQSVPQKPAHDCFILKNTFEEVYDIDPYASLRTAFYNTLSQRIAGIENQSNTVFCHGDLCVNNLIFKEGEGFTGAIDFELSGYSVLEVDFRHFIGFQNSHKKLLEQAYTEQTGHVLNEECMNMVDLMFSLKYLMICTHMASYEDQESEYNALQDRVRRLSYTVLGIEFPKVGYNNQLQNNF